MALPPKDPKLTFEPLSDGLGFHPFSDGLPYAPIGKTPTKSQQSEPTPQPNYSKGTGAVAAGAPSYRLPTPRLPQSQPPAQQKTPQAPRIPTAAPAQLRQPMPTPTQAPARPSQPFSHPQAVRQPHAPKAAPQTQVANTGDLDPELFQQPFGWVYLLKRIFAFSLDSAFNLSLCAGALSLALIKQDLSPELLMTPGVVLISGLFLVFFNWAITTAEEVAFGTSVGKRVFGLALRGSASAVFLRSFFFLPSLCFGGIGLLWSLFDRRHRCWHDLVVDLQPIEIARL